MVTVISLLLNGYAQADQTSDALHAAGKATFITTGLGNYSDKLGKYFMDELRWLAPGAAMYKVYRDKQASFPLDKNHKLKISTNAVIIEISL